MTPDEARIDRTDNEAMSIIHRAAILLEERGDACMTPGASYETSIKGPGELSITVRLSDEQRNRLAEQIAKHPYRLPYMEALMHDYFQVAVWRILEGKVV